MLRLLLRITVGWFLLSLLCSCLWVLFIELGRMLQRAQPPPTQSDTPAQIGDRDTLTPEQVWEMLLQDVAAITSARDVGVLEPPQERQEIAQTRRK